MVLAHGGQEGAQERPHCGGRGSFSRKTKGCYQKKRRNKGETTQVYHSGQSFASPWCLEKRQRRSGAFETHWVALFMDLDSGICLFTRTCLQPPDQNSWCFRVLHRREQGASLCCPTCTIPAGVAPGDALSSCLSSKTRNEGPFSSLLRTTKHLALLCFLLMTSGLKWPLCVMLKSQGTRRL